MAAQSSALVGEEPTDSDVGPLAPPERRAPRSLGRGPVVAAIALGGGIGAAARYGAALLWPTKAGAFPWTTLAVNVVGCAIIGVFLVVITQGVTAHPLVRPFFGTGVLGGFTTFSTYAVDVEHLVSAGKADTALTYLALTVMAALVSVWAAATLTRGALAFLTLTRPERRMAP